MNSKNLSAGRTSALLVSLAVAPLVVWGLVFNGGALAHGGPVSAQVERMDTPPRASAPLKPEWVEALLDARATALRALLEARDIATQRNPLAQVAAPGSAVLKPDWVEVLLDARATALRALLEAGDIMGAHQ